MARRVTGLAPWQPTEKSLAVVKIAHELRDEWPLLVRRVLYVAYEHNLYPAKGKNEYLAVSNVLTRARRGGLLPWDAIADTTERIGGGGYDDLADFARTLMFLAEGYGLDRQAGQPQHLIVWSEHRGLAETVAGEANRYGVPFIPSGGFDATTVRYYEALDAVERDVLTVVLHLADLDTHGDHITDLLRRDLVDLYRDLGGQQAAPEVARIALTEAQARQVYPDHDGEDVQVDALPTPMLRGIVRDAIEQRIDRDVLDALLQREAVERGQAIVAVAGLGDEHRGPP